jgi:hypothetical protein
MKQCLIYDNSLRFTKGVYGTLTLIAFLIHNYWLVLAASILMASGVLPIFAIRFNIPYQFHTLISKKIFKDKVKPIKKEVSELKFVSAAGGVLFLIGFLLLYFGKFVDFAWIFVLTVSLLMFLACFVGACAAAAMYAIFKKIFNKQKNIH